ncbi:transposase, IS605 OrfB family, central region [Candidatus Methanoperedens nitroreducens]|uniref:Transposase, IS605 OrfB family, central region n=1 Tax=Candidatus Methanoperedens nitratireducens TaxID=1392998 RepID=A0A062UUF2_9EURY|nr:RNA-guided endonuclease TnpB family protein [Candidatus Methanoperedens nitroreducens]KCZ70661.1 transposase, IS605 OrfB family, central region [Candidatus Methanoperedens nitroreducens]MDJ1420514.1 transposase [Candidatus Methanoperedens sp.]
MNVIRTEHIELNPNETLSELCHYSKNLWNEANYTIRQEFFANGRWIRYGELDKKLKSSENYKALNAQSAQQTLRLIDKSWKGTFEGIKERTKNPDKFLGKVKLPKYKPKDGETILIFTNQQASIKDGNLTFPKNLSLNPIKTRLPNNMNLREVRIIPKGTGYTCEIVYKTLNEEGEINKRWYARRHNENRIAGIDLGTVNIVTIGNNIGEQPIVIKDDGTGIKSINQFYNKSRAELQSIYDLQGIKHGSRMDRLNFKRNLKINDQMHKISRYVINYCKLHNIGTLVIGHNDNWKQKCDLGERNNQNFVSIPYYKLIQMLQYKAEEAGITIKMQEESHTSKCSFLDNESIEHHDRYIGKRIKRGLFRSAKGILINADVQGAYNIIRKSEPNAFQKWNADGVGGCGLHPERANIKKILSFAEVC